MVLKWQFKIHILESKEVTTHVPLEDTGTNLPQVVKSVNNWTRDCEQLLCFKFFGQSMSEGQAEGW